MFRLSDGEEIMALAVFVLIQYRSVTDRQTDRHLCSGYTSACIARCANAFVKIYGFVKKRPLHDCTKFLLKMNRHFREMAFYVFVSVPPCRRDLALARSK